jgi:RecB family endonuclease NucS
MASLIAEFCAACDTADGLAIELIALEADSVEGKITAEEGLARYQEEMRRYYTGDAVEDRFRAERLVESLAQLSARALLSAKPLLTA